MQGLVVAVQVVEDAGCIQLSQRQLADDLGDLLQRACAAGECDKGIAQFDHFGLAGGDVLRHEQLGQALVLQLCVQKALGLYTGHPAACSQYAVG